MQLVGQRSAVAITAKTVACRQFATSSRRHASRFYRYAIDVHGQLFLHDTTPKNLTSCFKNPQFLDFFFARIKPNRVDTPSPSGAAQSSGEIEPDWTERKGLQYKEAAEIAHLEKYHWVSPCQGESNFIRAAKSPIVFRELTEDGTLHWAGTFTSRFDPSSLKVDPVTGYVYHPSPVSSLGSVRKLLEEEGPRANPYGAYSLLSSALVMQRLATGLDVDPDAFADGKGGSIEWEGKRWEIGILKEGDLA